VQNKISPRSNQEVSTPTQYVIDIDTSLFSDDYGIVSKYSIYVRRGKKSSFFLCRLKRS